MKWLSKLKILNIKIRFKSFYKTHRYIIVFLCRYAQRKAFDLFPDNSPSKNHDLSLVVYEKLIGEQLYLGELDDEDNKQVELLLSKLKLDEDFIKAVSDYFLFKEFISQYIGGEGDLYLHRARSFNSQAMSLNDQSCIDLGRFYKNKLEGVLFQLKRYHQEKIRDLEKSTYSKIEITPSNLMLFVTFVTSLITLGGYLYISITMSFLKLHAGHYFTLYDYISSYEGVGSILILTILWTISFVVGMRNALRKSISDQHFELERSTKHSLIKDLLLVLLCAFLWYGFYIQTDEIFNQGLVAIILSIFYVTIGNMDFWLIFKNYFSAKIMTHIALIILLLPIVNALNMVDALEKEKIDKGYEVILQPEYQQYSDYQILFITSNYVILVNEMNGAALPKEAVYSISTKMRN